MSIRNVYTEDDMYLGEVDGKLVLKLMLEYLLNKSTHFQSDFRKIGRRKVLNKSDAKKILLDYLELKIPDIVLYDNVGSLFESYEFGATFLLNLTKGEYAEFQKILIEHNLPKDLFYCKDSLNIIRKKRFGLVVTEKPTKKPKKTPTKKLKKTKRKKPKR